MLPAGTHGCIWFATFFAAAPAPAPAPAEPGFSLFVDGREFKPSVATQSGSDRPTAGDVASAYPFTFTLGEPGRYDFKLDDDDFVLERVLSDGKTQPFAVRVAMKREKDTEMLVNPLAKLSDAQLRLLRGVTIETWNPEILAAAGKLDPAVVTITVRSRFGRSKAGFPALPTGLERLEVEVDDSVEVGPLAGLTRLRHLELTVYNSAFDVALLSKMTELRTLEIGADGMKSAAGLAPLTKLVRLRLAGLADLDTVAFAKGMSDLTDLDIRRTGVTDLAPLSGLTKLRQVEADVSKVRTLPTGAMPALKRLSVLSAAVPDAAAAAFAKENPQCELRVRWNAALAAALKGADRVRVRSGGTCHRDIAEEKTLADVKDAKVVAELLAAIEIDEAASRGSCRCCGSPSLEFYRAGVLTVTLGFHHGHGIRWPGNLPADAMLTDASADRMTDWMSAAGIQGPKEERERGRRQAEASRRRNEKYAKLLSAELMAGLRAARSREAVVTAFEKAFPEPADRLLACWRVLGMENAAWNEYDNFAMMVNDVMLHEVSAETARAAARRAGDDLAADGAGKWLFADGNVDKLDAKTLAEVLPRLGARALGHPKTYNRTTMVGRLAGIATAESTALLRTLLAGGITVRPLPKDEEEGPGGSQVFRPGEGEGPDISDRARAAVALSARGDKESLPAMKAYAATAPAGDKAALAKAIAALEARP